MKIRGNQELINLRAQIENLNQLFTVELEEAQNEHKPVLLRLEKRKSNIIYYLVMTLFLFIFISVAVFLNVLEAYYLILIVYGINLVLSGIGFFLLHKVNKEFKFRKSIWDKRYNWILKYQDQVTVLYKKAEEEVYKIIALSMYHLELSEIKSDQVVYDKLLAEKIKLVKKQVFEELGENPTSEAVVLYYLEWGEKVTRTKDNDFDYLEARRQKAILRSKNIDIDSKGKD